MNIEVISTEYKDNKRIDTATHTYTIVDDYRMLGRMYLALADKTEKGEDVSELWNMIAKQLEYINGYNPCSPQ